mmetsp:Transcript_12495/g.30654  ORF Transcript_12495/g.30654 Transcript_12495/m.30654 type:complete len:234 (-) Transcript_12495:30-731(-)
MHVLGEELLVEVVASGVVDEALLLLWLVACLVPEDKVIVPPALHPKGARPRPSKERVPTQHRLLALLLLTQLILDRLLCSLLLALLLDPLKLLHQLCRLVLVVVAVVVRVRSSCDDVVCILLTRLQERLAAVSFWCEEALLGAFGSRRLGLLLPLEEVTNHVLLPDLSKRPLPLAPELELGVPRDVAHGELPCALLHAVVALILPANGGVEGGSCSSRHPREAARRRRLLRTG